MATATQRTEKQQPRKGNPPAAPKDEPAVKQPPAAALAPTQPANGAVMAAPDFSSDAGRGMEGATQESFAIPFLSLLQKGSPQVDESSGTALPDAKQGMFFENVTGRLINAKGEGHYFVPCAYRRVFLRWGPRAAGGGFKGELLPEEVATLRSQGKIVELDGRLFFPNADGEIHPDKCDRVGDHRNHYGLLVDEKGGGWTQALISITSTQIKKSKALMSALASVKLTGASGQYTPATWANRVRFSSVPEQNDKGSWMGWRFELDGTITRADLYAAGRAFNEAVRRGNVEVKYEEPEDPTTVDSGGAAAPGKAGGTF